MSSQNIRTHNLHFKHVAPTCVESRVLVESLQLTGGFSILQHIRRIPAMSSFTASVSHRVRTFGYVVFIRAAVMSCLQYPLGEWCDVWPSRESTYDAARIPSPYVTTN